ncbi:MAG: glycerate kinase, partial [Escherichia coli]|nr:glycerate kinase [Escherichia coli]
MKIVIAPDSFKESLSAEKCCQAIKAGFSTLFPDANYICLPIADGGEGSVDAFLAAMPGVKRTCICSGPYGERIEGYYGLLEDGTAVIEMAAAAGLPLVGDDRRVEATTTYGVGELLMDAIGAGATRVIMGLGGSATNDGACGMAAACGVRFLNENGETFVPVGGTLADIARIDMTGLDERVREIPVVTMCDIDNPLCGPTGAAAIFAPQKGASPAQVDMLDAGLAHLEELFKRDPGID